MTRFMISLMLLLAGAPCAGAEWALRKDLGQRLRSIEVATFPTEQECLAGARIAVLALDAANEGEVVTAHGAPTQVVIGEHVYVLRCVQTIVQTPQ